jgi:PBP1b-binding outer membrane lipoprotein LpoB
MELRKSIILALALMLSACNACAFGGPGSIVVDIVGSVTDNTKITSSGMEKIELEIIGSESNNTMISPPEKEKKCPKYICPDTIYPEVKNENKEKRYPWENMHLGVDAWYGTFWYDSNINLPNWPQF